MLQGLGSERRGAHERDAGAAVDAGTQLVDVAAPLEAQLAKGIAADPSVLRSQRENEDRLFVARVQCADVTCEMLRSRDS